MQLDEWQHPAIRLFAFFSRFEYALKSSGFAKQGRSGEVSADWDTFSKSLDPNFFSRMSSSKLTSELFQRPPRKQVLDGKRLTWHPERPAYPPPPTDTANLFVYIRRVRNNLFHGGKVPFDFVRDRALIEEALSILESALSAAPSELRTVFYAPTE